MGCFSFFGKILVIVQIEFVKTEKIKAISVNNRSKYLCQYASNNYELTTGVTVPGLTDIKLSKIVYICVAVTKK